MSENATEPRVAIVTGASGGIGRASALRLAADGFAVVVHYGGNVDRAQSVVDEITSAGGRASAFSGDIGEEADVIALFQHAEDTFGGVDVVVSAAGIMPLSTVVETELEVFDRVQRINLRGTFIVDQQAARRVRRGGAIINFSTSMTRMQQTSYGAYAASKGAVEALTLILARELRGRDVTVNAVAPGPTATPLFLDGKPQELVDRIASLAPLERLGTPEDIAEMVSFLAGPARWVNGQVLYTNGGIA